MNKPNFADRGEAILPLRQYLVTTVVQKTQICHITGIQRAWAIGPRIIGEDRDLEVAEINDTESRWDRDLH
jgi:hypothetical protein